MDPQEPKPPRPLLSRRAAPASANGRGTAQAGDLPRDELPQNPVSGSLEENRRILAQALGFQESFDVIFKELEISGRRALLVGLDGFLKDDILLRVTQFLVREGADLKLASAVERLEGAGVVYIETDTARTVADLLKGVLAGQAALLIDGMDAAVLIDQRTYPARGPDEPSLERVVRGPRDGFTETLVFNTALIRRRMRDPNLRFELLQVGKRSRTDVVIAYVSDIADPDLVGRIRSYIEAIDIDALPMAEKSLEEFLVPEKRWWNPFPTVRYSERPDVVAAHLHEGHVAVLVDTSPSVMLLPATFFHHMQHAQEYHDEPITGAAVRWLRLGGFLAAWFLPPLWLALALSQDLLPPALQFIGPREPGVVPLGLQFILAELAADLVWIALIHTPDALATSLGLVGALLLGQQAVDVGLFSVEALFYTAVAFIGTFATPSVELGNAIRWMRVLLLFVVALGGLAGFVIGAALTVLLMVSTRSFGTPYLYPLWPFKGRELINVLFRRPAPSRHFRPAFTHPIDPDVRRGPSRR